MTVDTDMEDIKKFYSDKAILIGTFFGGPLAAGYLAKKNFQVMDKPDLADKSFVIGILSTVLLFAGIFSIPEDFLNKLPRELIPMIYTPIIGYIIYKFQGQFQKVHKESGGAFHSGWKAAGIGAISMLIIIASIMVVIFAGELFASKPDFDSTKYDKEVALFTENEKKALAVFSVIETASTDRIKNELKNGIVLWKKNKEIVFELYSITNLPKPLLDQNILLLKYCDLRIEHNQIIIKAVTENTDKYVPEIDRIGSEIEKVLDKLK